MGAGPPKLAMSIFGKSLRRKNHGEVLIERKPVDVSTVEQVHQVRASPMVTEAASIWVWCLDENPSSGKTSRLPIWPAVSSWRQSLKPRKVKVAEGYREAMNNPQHPGRLPESGQSVGWASTEGRASPSGAVCRPRSADPDDARAAIDVGGQVRKSYPHPSTKARH